MNNAVREAYIAAGEAAVKAADAANTDQVAGMAMRAAKRTAKAAHKAALDASARATIAMETAEDAVLNSD